jgi:6-phosphogluconate dehydrogenase (decarboxylating)
VNVTIVGTGNMARAIGRRLLAGGHGVTVLGKEVEAAEQVVDEIGGEGSAQAGRSGDPIADDVVVLAVYYPDATSAVEQYGDALSGKVVVDITNPVNETFDDLVTPPDGSAAQELQGKASGGRRRRRQGHGGVAGRGRRPAPGGRRTAQAGPRARGGRPAPHERPGPAGHGLRERPEGNRLRPYPS